MPGLLPVIDALDKVAEPLRQFYEAKDGKFHLILDAAPSGFVPATELAAANGKVVEFRDNNIKLTKKVEELEPKVKAFDGLDAVTVRSSLTELEALKKKGVSNTDDLDVKMKAVVDAALKPITEQLTASNASLEAERKRADESTLRSIIGETFTKTGGVPNALDYIVSKARDVFEVKDGRVVAQSNKFSSEKPGDPLPVSEWMTGMTKEADFAFKPSSGGGATPPGAGGGGGALKPGQTELRNPTPAQLGEHSKAILDGKVVVRYDQPAAATA